MLCGTNWKNKEVSFKEHLKNIKLFIGLNINLLL